MDKSCPPPPTDSSTGRDNSRDEYLKHLNKLSHKIAKPNSKKPISDHLLNRPPPPLQIESQPLNLQQQPPPQHQPPVYNINKSDFRDVVQKLTGSHAHDRLSSPPPIQTPKSTSSRLQKIRPPPLPQLNVRPSPMATSYGGGVFENVINQNPSNQVSGDSGNLFRQVQQQFSPLPPFPSVHTAAESPISAYMRYFQNSSFVSPRLTSFAQPPPVNGAPTQTTASSAAPSLHFPMPSSSLPLGCVPSPKSPYPSLFSPTTLGFQNFPLSPTVPSPRWKGV